MALDLNGLAAALVQVFQDGKNASTSDEVAEAMAQAIHDYVSQAVVEGIEVEVVDTLGTPIGSGTQTTAVTIS